MLLSAPQGGTRIASRTELHERLVLNNMRETADVGTCATTVWEHNRSISPHTDARLPKVLAILTYAAATTKGGCESLC